MNWEQQLNELYQEYYGRDVDPGGLRTYSKRHWRNNPDRMREELRDSQEHRDFLKSDAWREREAARTQESQASAKDYWDGEFSEIQVVGRGTDISPHDDALRTFYMEDRVDQYLDDKESSIHATTEIMENIESKFLDEVYDSEGKTREGVDATWGLDLQRKGLNENMDVRSPEFYDILTKGDVNWAAYTQDPAYIAAFEKLLKENPTVYADWDKDPGEGLSFNIQQLGQGAYATQSIELIREANKGLYKDIIKNDDDGWKRHWEGKYDPDKIVRSTDGNLYIDNERQIGLGEKFARKEGDINPETGEPWTAQERGRLFDPKDAYSWTADNIVGPQTPVVKPDSLKIENIRANKVEVKRPSNIPASWGAV